MIRLFGLANGGYIEKNMFAFRFYDIGRDDVIGASDIVSIFESIVIETCG